MPTIKQKEAQRLRDMILASAEPDVQIKMIETLEGYGYIALRHLLDITEAVSDAEVKKAALDAIQRINKRI